MPPHGPQSLRITDVSLRDGLQNEPRPISTAEKFALGLALHEIGVQELEVSSFVSAKWVPQLGDAAELFAMLAARKPKGMVYSALVPNMRGMEGLLAVNQAHAGLIDKVSVFTAASETFAQRNTNASIAETLQRFEPVVESAKAHGLQIRGYVSTVVACPFEGAISSTAVAAVAERLHGMGCDEIDLGDTIGAANAESIRAVIDAVAARIGGTGKIVIHLHDTFGRAGECVRAAIARGVHSFDATVAGLGGCPYAGTPEKPAPGNIDLRTLLRASRSVSVADTIDDAAVERAATLAQRLVRGA